MSLEEDVLLPIILDLSSTEQISHKQGFFLSSVRKILLLQEEDVLNVVVDESSPAHHAWLECRD